ncbi:MAG: hypothetical protein A2Z78_00720 [Candidatus Nealsonbacteria bacterium RBG_13_36_15]|uniref:Uncharacterized protein n=1 Tax=Candidatus Nealsonbacteria bacterium RBG_13_36_15 TaxID=1801660 RepID=A0A1G2DWB6_9BACT|nr:MAG: hypothetical protein A2Z78_00720 [Candidatus Nealsonbacteria bacterium RBG_13_36_15]
MEVIREFLRPNKWKIGLFPLVIIFAVSFIIMAESSFGTWANKPMDYYLFTIPLILPFSLGGIMEEIGILELNWLTALVSLFLTLFYWYFLACLIYFVINKIKVKPK